MVPARGVAAGDGGIQTPEIVDPDPRRPLLPSPPAFSIVRRPSLFGTMGKIFGGFFALWLLAVLILLGFSATALYFGFQQVTTCWVRPNTEICWFD